MIDLHSHFLYGVDDGPSDLPGSMELLRQAREAGITEILATPHLTEHSSRQDQLKIQAVFSEIKEHLAESGLPIKIHLAAEIYYSPNMVKWVDQSWPLIGPGRTSLLFDIPLQFIPPDLPETIFQLVRRKIIPIMAHPERNSQLQKEPHRLSDWMRLGCIMQMDAGSMTGEFGRACQRFSVQLLDQGAVQLIASDAHDCVQRSFRLLVRARQLVEKKFGRERARLLFNDNPRRILSGERLIRFQQNAAATRVNFLQKITAKFRSALRVY
jgi:protein-tyrosine phosphatase